MNNKRERINQFLRFFCDILKQNPDMQLTLGEVYRKLTHLDIPDDNEPIKQFFPIWIDYFSTDRRCTVRNRAEWSYFCEFFSADLKAKRSSEHLKVYVPLDSKHIEKGAIEIFEFLSNEGIPHTSKISGGVRFDDICIRLINPDDLNKLLDFVSKNQYIQEGLIKANPFAFNKDGIALAVDGRLTYNGIMANLITLYLNDKKAKNDLDNVDLDDFVQFIKKYYTKVFSSYDGQKMLDRDFAEVTKDELDIEISANYRNIFRLMIKSLNNDSFSYNDYIAHYRECSNGYQQHLNMMEIQNMIDLTKGETKDKLPPEGENEYSDKEKEVVLQIKEILDVMGKKYGQGVAKANLNVYVNTGSSTHITRENNLRERIVNSTFRDDLKEILKKRGVDLDHYLDIIHSITSSANEIYLEQAIIETYDKYEDLYQRGVTYYDGKRVVMGAIRTLLQDGDYHGFTRNNNARKNLEDNISASETKKIIIEALGFQPSEISYVTLEAIEKYTTDILAKYKGKSI